jgi:tetratricopeptide (TPR) repeat protein
MPDAELKPYTDALAQTTPQAKASALEAYLTAFPKSACPDSREYALEQLMLAYYSVPVPAKAIDAADRVLQLNPNNLFALDVEALFRKPADSVTDPAAQQAAMDTAAGYAQRGLVAPKPANMDDATFKTQQAATYPTFYSVIGNGAFLKKDSAAAIDAFKKELASVPVAQTQAPGTPLQDTFFLGETYWQSTPPDYLNCAFYAARAAAYAPEPFKTQFTKIAKYCYKAYHGADDGYDAVVTVATANLNPPDGFQASVKPAPTPAEIIAGVIASTPKLDALAPDDREYIIQNGTPEQIAKVWDAIKGKSVTYPGGLVTASTPTQVQVAIGTDAVQSKTADFTFNLTPPEEIPEPKAGATPAQKAAYTKAVAAAKKEADATAAATAVGQTVTLQGTYDSYAPKPIMFTMSDASVVLPTAAKTPAVKTPARSPARAPVRKPAATAK